MGSGNSNAGQKKITAAQRAERIKAAQEREKRYQAQKERSSRMKKIFTIIVCVILILALSIPTMALTVCSVGAA